MEFRKSVSVMTYDDKFFKDHRCNFRGNEQDSLIKDNLTILIQFFFYVNNVVTNCNNVREKLPILWSINFVEPVLMTFSKVVLYFAKTNKIRLLRESVQFLGPTRYTFGPQNY